MSRVLLALALGLTALTARAGNLPDQWPSPSDALEAPPPPESKPIVLPRAPAGGGWVATDSSLLLYDRRGKVAAEMGLGRWRQELGDGRARRRRARGGTCADGRFAWHWQKLETVRSGRVDEVLESSTTLAYLGTSGQLLWESPEADAPEGLSPLLQSADGETALLVERSSGAWSVTAMGFTGNRIMRLEALHRLEGSSMTASGRYATVLWAPRDAPLTYSFLDLPRGRRHDIPASETPAGSFDVSENGAVRARPSGRTVFRFQ